MDIVWKGSPNFTKGRTVPIDRVVIHWFGSGTLESANTRFQNPASEVSAHYGVSEGRVWQWVKEEDISYNAGNWEMNKRSIGIEHDATTKHNLSELDYQTTGKLVYEICQRHNIPLDRTHIIGHREVKATQCPGTIDIDRIIKIAESFMSTTLNVQLVFNSPPWGKEAALKDQAANRMSALSEGKTVLNFLPNIYTNYSDIPTRIFMDPFSGEQDQAVERDWILHNVWSLNKNADVVVFVGNNWNNQANGVTTFGHYYSTKPMTFPAVIQLWTGENDWSWKWPALPAFVHYLTHEVSHALFQAQGQDRTHELDYASIDGLKQGLPYLDYNKINYALTHKVGYISNYMVYKKQGDGTLYFSVGDVLIPFATSYENFLKDLRDSVIVELSPDEFLKLKIAGTLIVEARK